MTTSVTASPVWRSTSAASALRMNAEIAGADHSLPWAEKRHSWSPTWRFTRLATLSGSMRAWRLACLPTTTWSSPSNSTTDGVVGSLSRLLMTSGRPKRSTREMHE